MRALAVVLALALPAAARADVTLTGWDGTNPFNCVLQEAGQGTTVPDPGADPYCVHFDKSQQNVTQAGIAAFLAAEPARFGAAAPKCFYFQSDHWRGSIVQDSAPTELYEFYGHYFFDKAVGGGGAWVTQFNVNGRTGDPSAIPGVPPQFAQDLGPGTGGGRVALATPADPNCAARAARDPAAIYAAPANRFAGPLPPAPAPPSGAAPSAKHVCAALRGRASASALGLLRPGMRERALLRLLGSPVRSARGALHFCLRGGGALTAVLAPGRLGEAAAPVRLLLSTSRPLRAGVRPAGGVVARLGRTVVHRSRSGVLVGSRARHIVWVAVYDHSALRTAAALRGALRRALA